MTTQRFDRIVRRAAARSGYNPSALYGKRRTEYLCKARKEAWQALYNRGYSVERIATEFDRTRSAVNKGVDVDQPREDDVPSMPRHQDHADCAHYNATDKQDRSWRDGCLYLAAKANRKSVCPILCDRYTPQVLKAQGHLTSSAGLCLDEDGAGVGL